MNRNCFEPRQQTIASKSRCTAFLLTSFFSMSILATLVLPEAALAQKKDFRLPGIDTSATGGQRDFDFELGTWHTELRRLKGPLLAGGNTWLRYSGSTIVRPACDGQANLVELKVKGDAGSIEGLSLRIYDPATKQWSLHFANMRGGGLQLPAVGQFRNGEGVFYNEDTYNDKKILIRFVISKITLNSCHFEQAFSADGGNTWEVNWIADDRRVAAVRPK